MSWVRLTVEELRSSSRNVIGELAAAQARRHRANEPKQMGAWDRQLPLLRSALADAPGSWELHLEFELLRLGKRIDAVLLTDRAILVMEFKTGASSVSLQDRRQVEDYALDLFDFHSGSRAHPVVPVLVATDAPALAFDPPLLWHGVTPVLGCNAAGLPALIACTQHVIAQPLVPLDPQAWAAAPYRPTPTIIEAATQLYRTHAIGDLVAARSDTANLSRTTDAILSHIDAAQRDGRHLVLFVTGIPGAGKTLCGMNVVFGHGRATFLTGNAPLVAVLKESLARNAAGEERAALRSRAYDAKAKLQNVHKALEHYVSRPSEVPHEQIIVFDEAQRAWNAEKATKDSQNRTSSLTTSEPAHALEIMGRHPDWAVVVALVGSGQEINSGEAGLRNWAEAIIASGRWRAVASPHVIGPGPPALRLAPAPAPWLETDARLHLDVSIRSVRSGAVGPWVDAVIAGDRAAAARHAVAEGDAFPVFLTRSLDRLREVVRALVRGTRRPGLVASSGARRLRADGLGAEFQGDKPTAHWFLDRWPDVRGSDSLEMPATEYSCQGLELDVVGVCWGGDFVRGPHGWLARRFNGSDDWQTLGKADNIAFVHNKYRVLLTRARYESIIWVPRGDAGDATRRPQEMDVVADFLLACGARPLDTLPVSSRSPEALLL